VLKRRETKTSFFILQLNRKGEREVKKGTGQTTNRRDENLGRSKKVDAAPHPPIGED